MKKNSPGADRLLQNKMSGYRELLVRAINSSNENG